MPDAVLAVKDLRLDYGSGHARVRALDDVSLTVEAGTVTLISGPSGSGKTSLLSVVGCLLRPDSGSIRIGQHEVANMSEPQRVLLRQSSIGYVFQSFRLFSALSAVENVAMGLQVCGMPRRAALRRAIAALERVGLGDKHALYQHELSGGERQRVAVARAVVKAPPLILADEPTASLDSVSGANVAGLLRELARTENCAVVMVSHDPRVLPYADGVAHMADGRLTGGMPSDRSEDTHAN